MIVEYPMAELQKRLVEIEVRAKREARQLLKELSPIGVGAATKGAVL